MANAIVPKIPDISVPLSYTKMMKTLSKDSNKVPKDMQKMGAFITMTILESRLASLVNGVNKPSRLNETTASINNNLEMLGSNQRNINAQQFKVMYQEQFNAAKQEALERIDQRKSLMQQIREYVTDTKRQKFAEAIEKFEAKKPPAEIERILDEIEKKQKDLAQTVAKSHINEDALQGRLDDLNLHTHQHAVSVGLTAQQTIPTKKA